MRSVLSDVDDGFNARLAAIAGDYGITPFTIDWGPDSSSFQEAQIDSTGLLASRLSGISFNLYTSESAGLPPGVRPKGGAFAGTVRAHLDVTLMFSDGDLSDDLIEDNADAVEDVVIQLFVDENSPFMTLFFSGPVYFAGEFACARSPIEQTEKGFSQLLPFQFIYEVHV